MFGPFPRPAQARSLPTSSPKQSYTLSHHDTLSSLNMADTGYPYNAIDANKSPTASSKQKECHFLIKHGSRHHSYDLEKAPYPLSYDRVVFEVCVAFLERYYLRLTPDSEKRWHNASTSTLRTQCPRSPLPVVHPRNA